MDITIYSTTTCSFCHALSGWLDKQNVPYVKKNTDEDLEALDEFISVSEGDAAVPFTVIKDAQGSVTKILGFDQAKFKQALSL